MAKFFLYIQTIILFIVLICFTSTPIDAYPTDPSMDLIWKNVKIEGKRIAVYSFLMDSHGAMWIGSGDGLYFYDGINSHSVDAKTFSGVHIHSIVEKDNVLFLGTTDGLYIYEPYSGRVSIGNENIPKEIRSLLLHDNTLYIGSMYGLFKLDISTNQLTDLSKGLPHNSIYSILRDSRGIIYVGTYSGLVRLDSDENGFHKVSLGNFSDNIFVNCLMEAHDQTAIYIGGNGGLYKYSPSKDTCSSIPLLDGHNVKTLTALSDGTYVAGTEDGVYFIEEARVFRSYHDSRIDWSLQDNEVWCVYSDFDGNLWAGHGQGFSVVSKFNSIKTVRISSITGSGDGNGISSIYRDTHAGLWIGGTNGLIHLDNTGRSVWFREGRGLKCLSNRHIRSIDEDSDGNVWISTDGGVHRYDRDGDCFDVFHIQDSDTGHISDWIYSIQDGGDYLWVANYLGGIHKVSKSKFGENGNIVVSDLSYDKTVYIDSTQNIRFENDFVNNMVMDNSGNVWVILFGDSNVYKLSSDGSLWKYDVRTHSSSFPAQICEDANGRIWCAFKGGAVVFSEKHEPIPIEFPFTDGDATILSMNCVDNDIWVSTLSNLWKIDGRTLSVSIIPIAQKSYLSIYQDPLTGKILLGGEDEFVEVDRTQFDKNLVRKSIKLLISNCNGKTLKLEDRVLNDFHLVIPNGGNISIVIGTLDYFPDSAQRYMYKLAKSPADTLGGWVILPEGSNVISLSKLEMGDYQILVKMTSAAVMPLSIPLTVRPPWLLTWWAIIIYCLLLIALVYMALLVVKRRNQRYLQEEERRVALENVEKKLSFLSTISHDFKTPLSLIIGPVCLIKDKVTDSYTKKVLDSVYENAVKLNNMIHRTLEMNRFNEDGDPLMIMSTFDAVAFCRGIFESFKENNNSKQFIFHSDCGQIYIENDAVKLESVITNIVSNACKYSDDGATITCGISRKMDMLEIVIADDGIGIAEKDQPLVYHRMFRASSRVKAQEGTGLGLYLIKKYIELMNGRIELYSKEGQGSSFIVSIPITINETSNVLDIPKEDNGGKCKILIVEDNMQMASFIAELLKPDYTVLVAENGSSALAIASSFVPDLIITDETMPIMSGLEMSRRLKKNPRLETIPIIMLTAKDDNDTENESIKMGIDAFVGKPFEPVALLGRVSQILDSRRKLMENMRIEAITQTKPIEQESIVEKQLAQIASIIEDNISDPDLNVNQLCEKSGIANKQLYRLLKKYIGLSPLDYIRKVRLQKAAMLLSQHRFTVSEVSYMVGFKTPAYFSKCFQANYGVKPSQYESDDSPNK